MSVTSQITHNEKVSVRNINVAISAAVILGFAVSFYAYKVERMTEYDPFYEAVCDISEHVSCTKAFLSEYGRGLGIFPVTSVLYLPNAVFGVIFYGVIAALSCFTTYATSIMVLALVASSNIGTIYLVYVSIVIKNACLVCITIYIINAILFFLVTEKHRRLF
ncbi:vitamin-K epoxide reductase [Andrena cerasifolii]|uniref:vitamin-K epoxide reductase n=1 Tax=Andrena cerasifolii TaxID=2819439 RepID=UPI004037B0D9